MVKPQIFHTKHISSLLIICCAGLIFAAMLEAAQIHPLAPPDTSSPRATLQSFLTLMRKSKAIVKQDRYYKQKVSRERDEFLEEQAERLFDFRDIPVERIEDIANYSRPLLADILDRIELPPEETIPDAAAVKADNLTRWTIPHTEITLLKIEDGPQKDQWLFSAETVKHLKTYYELVKNLPLRSDAIYGGDLKPGVGAFEAYMIVGEESFPSEWIEDLPEWAKTIYLENAIWKWLVFATVLILSTGIFYLITIIILRLRRHHKKDTGFFQMLRLIPPISGAVLAHLAEYFIDEQINAVGIADVISETGLWCIALVFWAWAVIVLGSIISGLLIRSWQKNYQGVYQYLASILMRIISFLFAGWIVLYGVERLGLSIMPLLAGLGIGGIAIALAVRPTLENLIGSIVLFIDKPVEVGDLCKYSSSEGSQLGIVEKIGLRSTRLRKRNDTLVTIPNAQFCQLDLENLSSREMTLLKFNLSLRYETSSDQLRRVLTYLRKMMIGHPKVSPERMQVRFVGFGDSSLDIKIFAYIRTQSYPEYQAIREDINLRIIDIVNDSGTGFAFPSQTTYIRRDTGLDDEKTHQSENEVEEWRSKRNLPFPDFEPEDKDTMTDTLDYPPDGSPKMIEPDKRLKLIEIWKWKRHKGPDKPS